ncbi:hypothetical protein [Humibacter sp.]|uniref:hypothetical protein n=1 Tax=Humibacter sp. TaxID=1940291 RepID=UPI003F7EEB8F
MPSLDFSHAWPWLQWIIAVAAVVAFLGGAIRVIPGAWRAVSRFVTTINSLADLPEFIKRTDDSIAAQNTVLAKQSRQLDGVFHETHRNDGSSIKDSTVRLEKAVADLTASTEGLHGRMDRVETGVAGLYGKVDELEAADGEADERLDQIEKTIPRHELPKSDG